MIIVKYLNYINSKRFLMVIGIILFLAFVGFSYLVAKEIFVQFDFDTTVKFQDKIPRRLDGIFSWFSVLGSAEVTGIIWFLILFLLLFKKFWKAAFSLFLLPLALALEVYGKLFVHHPAPPFLFYRGTLDVSFPIHFTHTDYSYPSGHETRTAFLVVFLMCYFFYRGIGRFRSKHNLLFQFFVQSSLLGILAVMTVSRIYLGEHWTTDVIGGFLIGAGFGMISGAMVPVRRASSSVVSSQ